MYVWCIIFGINCVRFSGMCIWRWEIRGRNRVCRTALKEQRYEGAAGVYQIGDDKQINYEKNERAPTHPTAHSKPEGQDGGMERLLLRELSFVKARGRLKARC